MDVLSHLVYELEPLEAFVIRHLLLSRTLLLDNLFDFLGVLLGGAGRLLDDGCCGDIGCLLLLDLLCLTTFLLAGL